ncbi:hypothetical protein P7C71_g988, partial [Lecanoromycetidae sp. Uapishka_2]
MDTITATTGQGKTSEALRLLLVHHRPLLVALRGPQKRMDCRPDRHLQVTRSGKDQAIEIVPREMMVEGDLFVTPAELEILTFQAILLEVIVIMIGTMDVGAEMTFIEEKKELIGNDKVSEGAKSFET